MEQALDRKNFPRTITSTLNLPEINKVNMERLLWDTVHASEKGIKIDNIPSPPSDLISRLPDDALCSILSHLSMRDTVRTSILSRRWRHLWKKSLTHLAFDVRNMARTISQFEAVDDDAFVEFVNQTLLHCATATIESFKVQRCLLSAEKYSEDITKWIEFAANKEVRNLDISLSTDYFFEPFYYENMFPHWLFNDQDKGSALRHLTLTCLPLDLPPESSHFSSLVSLTLKCVPLTQATVDNILSSCVSLQWLSMSHCIYSGKKLKFTSESCSSLKLKHLNISTFVKLKGIDIRDLENLTSFEFNCPSLRQVRCNEIVPVTRVCCSAFQSKIKWFDTKRRLAEKFPRLETLITAISPREAISVPNLPTFSNLKHLEFIVHNNDNVFSLLEPITSFLKASPLLQTLELHIYERPEWEKSIVKKENQQRKISSDSYRHDNLKKVEIHNFLGETEEVELIKYLVNHTALLEKIQIDSKCMSYRGDGEWEQYSFEVKPKIKRKTVLKMLGKIISGSTKLVVL